ncbi:MAG: hypothetical protein H6Q89_76 [Myxococcaceae bacterium]|nr:hypothetical protein [Myxococcaceae bacterium]
MCPGGYRGYGYECTGTCWQFFYDGPCVPPGLWDGGPRLDNPDGGLRDH